MIQDRVITNEVIPVENMFIELSYQRPLKDSKVKELVAKFDNGALTPLIVSRRENGKYAVIDGQHRFSALKKIGVLTTFCQVHHGLTVNEEADLFYKINVMRRPVNNFNKFRARVQANDEKAIHLENLAQKAGFKISIDSGGKSRYCIRAVGILERLVVHGDEHVLDVLNIVKEAFEGEPSALRGEFLEGLSLFIRTYRDELNRNKFIERLKQIKMNDFYRDSVSVQKLMGYRISSVIARSLLAKYNFNTRNKLPDIFDK